MCSTHLTPHTMCALPCPFAEHWNYFGMDEVLGPVAISIRREKLEDHKEHGQQYNYRIIFRTSEVSLPSASLDNNCCSHIFYVLYAGFFFVFFYLVALGEKNSIRDILTIST